MKWLTYVAIAASIGVVVLIVYGVLTHTEAGLIEGVPQWDRSDFPLSVSAKRYGVEAIDEESEGSIKQAIQIANERLGFDAFVFGVGNDVDILVGVPHGGEEWQDRNATSRIVHTAGRAERCEVQTSNVPTDLLWLVIYHEVGHCLGLAHDDFRLSIMYPEARSPLGIPPWITDSDRSLLRDLYSPH